MAEFSPACTIKNKQYTRLYRVLVIEGVHAGTLVILAPHGQLGFHEIYGGVPQRLKGESTVPIKLPRSAIIRKCPHRSIGRCNGLRQKGAIRDGALHPGNARP